MSTTISSDSWLNSGSREGVALMWTGRIGGRITRSGWDHHRDVATSSGPRALKTPTPAGVAWKWR